MDTGDLHWILSRPNGDSRLTLRFSPGHGGPHGDILLETIEDSIACHVVDHAKMEGLYFPRRFHGKFQSDVESFAEAIDQLDRKPR